MAEVIASIGFALQTYSSIVEAYKFLSHVQNLDKEAPILLWKLRMQQARFEVFGKHWGLDKPGFNKFIEEEGLLAIINSTLTSMKDMFDDAERLDKTYGVQAVPADGNTSSLVTRIKESKKFNITGRFKWALRDKSKFEKLILDLREYNDSLHSLLRLREATLLEKLAQSLLLQDVTKPETSSSLVVASLESAETPGSTVGTGRRSSPHLYVQLQKSAETKRFLLEYRLSGSEQNSSQFRSMLLDQKLLRYAPLNSPSDVRLIAEVCNSDTRPIPAIIDWRDTQVDDRVKPKVIERLNRLCELLSAKISKPEDLRVLECLGYFEDPHISRHGIVHRIPNESDSRPPITLYDLMARQYEEVPDLNERFELARALAISVLRLHDCGWLHTGFRSSNVIFFQQKQAFRQSQETSKKTPWRLIDFVQPYLIGFSYAKPTSLEEMTLEQSKSTLEHSLYRDPTLTAQQSTSIDGLETERVRLQMRHDYYSLGIVLLEIGLWDQITTMWKTKYTRHSFREKLLTAYVPKLGPRVGAVYRDVVVRLLTGSINASTETEEIDTETISSDSANWSIVTELSKCSA